ncbi:hypothetical protein Droror1_Dr00027565 [Drosera rotundifolia]
MSQSQLESPILLIKPPNHARPIPNPSSPPSPSIYLEIRLFYVRISPCVVDSVPGHLTLRHLRRNSGVSLEINGVRVPASDSVSTVLRRDRVDNVSSVVTYVSTDSVRLTGGGEFEVFEGDDVMVLCGSLERENWNSDSRNEWSMECFGSLGDWKSKFVQPKMGVSAPSIEVYVAGCWNGAPVILTKTINVSPRRKSRCGVLDVIPEDDEVEKEEKSGNEFLKERKLLQFSEMEEDVYEPGGKLDHSLYSDAMCNSEDGQLTWFNAGVRVGVGIGLGMCLGLGVGVGLLMRSYHATTMTLKRRFL